MKNVSGLFILPIALITIIIALIIAQIKVFYQIIKENIKNGQRTVKRND